MKKDQFDIRECEEIAKTLKAIADKYPKSSKEYQSIEISAKALLFACETKVLEKFETFLQESGKKLSPAQRDHLKRMGLLPTEEL